MDRQSPVLFLWRALTGIFVGRKIKKDSRYVDFLYVCLWVGVSVLGGSFSNFLTIYLLGSLAVCSVHTKGPAPKLFA